MKPTPKWQRPKRRMRQDRGTFFLFWLHWIVYNCTGVLAANQVLYKILGPEWAFNLPFTLVDIVLLFSLAGFVYLMFGYRLAKLNRK